ncbi:unnamed protein product, partial [Vitis vinifera]
MEAKMMYETIFARSFSRYEQKKLGYGAFAVCLITTFTIFTVFKPYLGPLPVLNLRLSTGGFKMLMVEDTTSTQQIVAEIRRKEMEALVCNIEPRSDFCVISGDVRVHGNSSTVFIASSAPVDILPENGSWSIRPYARKGDARAMKHIKNFTVKMTTGRQHLPHCTQNHTVPAILFSLGGYSGNHFHAFSDVLIPLYLTSRQFNGEVQFLVTSKSLWWIAKFRILLQELSRYPIIDIDREEGIHCFSSAIIGLKEFLRSSYSLKRATAIKVRDGTDTKKPRLLIIARKKSRSFTNDGKIAEMARSLGYEVIVAEPNGTEISRFAELVNSCDVLMGVHGAGLTNIVFLPENAVLIQVVPLGGLEWVARYDFGLPAVDMKIRYIEYQIKEEESSLIEKYPHEHAVLREPHSITKLGWLELKAVYLDKQNVKLDLNRFRNTLLQALQLLH